MSSLNNKQIILGVTGGIAAYKSADLCRRLREQGATVRIVMTQAAKEFITKLTLQAVSGLSVHDDLLDPQAEAAMGHIELARWADLILIAPASADFMAQLAHGHAKDLLSTLCLASKAPIAIAPAMNQQMWAATATQANVALLKQQNVKIMGPTEGSQACGDVGMGRMLEPNAIVQLAEKIFATGILAGKKVVITAGPTQEAMDPVRYLSNHSSGKQGYALAQAALEASASVTLISGPVALAKIARVNTIEVVSAAEMHAAVLAHVDQCDIFIAAAAVADYRVAEIKTHKIKKMDAELNLKLVRNPDILQEIAQAAKRPFCVGFAAETQDVIAYAQQKLQHKNLDLIVANQVGLENQGFFSDNNAVSLIWAEGQIDFPVMNKNQLAHLLIQEIAQHYAKKHSIKNS